MRKIGVVLLSGGLDSTTVAAYAKKQGYKLAAITFNYGQKHSREVEAARKVAQLMKMEQQVIDISFFSRLAWYSALTSSAKFEIPKERAGEEMGKGIPITYVPLRNMFFITMGAAFLESEVMNLIEGEKVDPNDVDPSLFIAANAVDYSGYPDCRPEFYKQMARAVCEGSKLGTQYKKPINIRTPVILKTKAEIVKMAISLNAPLEYTWSCYEGGEFPCGKCDSCILRVKGFAEAGYEDPLLLRLKKARRGAKGK